MTIPSSPPEIAPVAPSKRRGLLIAVTAVLLIVLLAYGIWWAVFLRHYESTDDAYVAGNVVQVTPQVGGTVLAINADDTELVQVGKPLIELDRQGLGRMRELRLVVERNARVQCLQRDQPIQRSAVEVMESKCSRDALRDRALARRGRAIDGDHHRHGVAHRARARNSAK